MIQLTKLSSALMSGIFKVKDIKYIIQKVNTLVSNNVKTTTYGLGDELDRFCYLVTKI